MRELTPREEETLKFLGNFHPTMPEQDCMIKGYMADSDGIIRVYLTSLDLQDLAEDFNSIAQWLDDRAIKQEAEE